MWRLFGEDVLLYPYVIFQRDGREGQLTLVEAIEGALRSLPHTRGARDDKKWNRLEAVARSRFGFSPKTRMLVGQELGGVSGERVRQLENKAIRLLLVLQGAFLRKFLILSPEEMAELQGELERLQKENEALQQEIERLQQERGEIEEWIERLGIPLFLPPDLCRDQELLRIFLESGDIPTLYRNALARAGIRSLSEFQRALGPGQKIPLVGEKGEIILREALNRFLSQEEQKALSQE